MVDAPADQGGWADRLAMHVFGIDSRSRLGRFLRQISRSSSIEQRACTNSPRALAEPAQCPAAALDARAFEQNRPEQFADSTYRFALSYRAGPRVLSKHTAL